MQEEEEIAGASLPCSAWLGERKLFLKENIFKFSMVENLLLTL